MGNQQTIKPETGLIKIPLNYPNYPTSGKLELLLQNNDKSIYHRYSPYTDGGSGLFSFGAKQPYIYDYIDKAKSGLSGLRRYESRAIPLGSAPRDVVRVSKFLFSGQGILFVGKQFLLQTSNAFNETRIYNPTSPIIAAGMSLSFGLIGRPQRHIDISGGLLGIATSLIGSTIPGLFGGDRNIRPPSGTLSGALPKSGVGRDGKGLVRAQSANKGQANLEAKWGKTKGGSGGFLSKLIDATLGGFLSIFKTPSQSPAKLRSDEHAYGLMIGAGSKKDGYSRFGYIGQSGLPIDFNQLWIGGTAGSMRRFDEKNTSPAKIYINPDGTPSIKELAGGKTVVADVSYIPGVGGVGYTLEDSTIESKPGIRYEDSIGAKSKNDNKDYYGASDVMVNYSSYSVPKSEHSTKKNDKSSIELKNDSLKKVISKLKAAKYDISSPDSSIVLPTGNNNDPLTSGYNVIFNTKPSTGNLSPINYSIGTLSEYRDKNVRMVSNDITTDAVNKSLKMPGAGNFDALNTLRVLEGDKSSNPRSIDNSKIDGWIKWDPYKDDNIAFFFYDAVNDKYIPFRCTVKGINETSTANVEELSFIGRADKLYSYNGFQRSLTFSFDVHVSSIVELSPTWNRINYLMSLTKPARYTKSSYDGAFNRFMVPPMIMLTIGDLYKKQPIIMNSVSLAIPEDATWETLSAENSEEWSYLVDYIKLGSLGGRYGQFPKTVTLTVNCYLLEKERAIVGAANFGHAPHTDAYYSSDFVDGEPNVMNKSLVTYQF